MPTDTVRLLRELIAFPTVSRTPNRDLIEFVRARLQAVGVDALVLEDSSGTKANLYATIGPQDQAGVLLSGHTDVVPTDGQDWREPPFALSTRDGKLYGRGTADMKGFIASALAAAERAAQVELRTPLHIALSYDEEIGCVGVRSLIDMLALAPIRPRFCIVGEPTGMAVATGHKGKVALRAVCRGREAHSALAPTGLNAIYLASEFIERLRALQADIVADGARDGDYDVPYTTIHVGTIQGGTALNIVPNQCELLFEVRTIAEDNAAHMVDRIEAAANAVVSAVRADFPEAAVEITATSEYPGLATAPTAEIVSFVKSLTGANETLKVAFGTEGGLFNAHLEMPVVVCGPGSMAQGHKPDEFIEAAQLQRCDAMMDVLITKLQAGL
jgi:acetylornithine deacetylase